MGIYGSLFKGLLTSFGMWMVDLGAVGAGLFGFFNRLLIPMGLHHVLNTVFWFKQLGVSMEKVEI